MLFQQECSRRHILCVLSHSFSMIIAIVSFLLHRLMSFLHANCLSQMLEKAYSWDPSRQQMYTPESIDSHNLQFVVKP